MRDTLYCLIATLLVLKLLSSRLPDKFAIELQPKVHLSGAVDPIYLDRVQKAVDCANDMNKAYPSLYSRLELGHNWESALEKLF